MEVRLGELQSEVKLKTFELDRFQLLYEENLKSLKTSQIELEKLEKKNEVSPIIFMIDERRNFLRLFSYFKKNILIYKFNRIVVSWKSIKN